MRYVTITNSRFYNNAAGLIPNALDSEKFPPAEDNIIRDNEIFWNNFNFHKGAPFKIATEGTSALAPGRHRRPAARRPPQHRRGQRDLRQLGASASRDRGHPAAGEPAGGRPRRQRGPRQRVRPRRHRPQRARAGVRRQRHGQLLRRQHRRRGDDPGRRLDVRAVPVRGRQRVQPGGARMQMLGTRRRGQRGGVEPPPARAQAGLRAAGAVQAVSVPPDHPGRLRRRRRAPVRGAGGRGRRRSQVGRGGRQLLPAGQADGEAGHDGHVEVAGRHRDRRPRREAQVGARRASGSGSRSPASSGYRYKRTLKKPGTYKIICTLHEEMTMTITGASASRDPSGACSRMVAAPWPS